MFLILIATLQ